LVSKTFRKKSMKTRNGTLITFEYEDGEIDRANVIMTFPCGLQATYKLTQTSRSWV
jgi:hypothetical protein